MAAGYGLGATGYGLPGNNRHWTLISGQRPKGKGQAIGFFPPGFKLFGIPGS